jgi:hypothetical protein
MSARTQREGHCWLCKGFGTLTREHTPPRSAFNHRNVRLRKVSEEHLRRGYVHWVEGPEHPDGHSHYTLCSKCNGLAGRSFAPSYRELCDRIAADVMSRQLLSTFFIERVRNPQLILRQIVFQFVTQNGAEFVDVNPWVRELLLQRKSCPLPEDVHLYLYVPHGPVIKTTGVGGFISKNVVRVASEFAFWPLGTVLSWGPLEVLGLTPIRDWAKPPFNSKRKVNLQLTVNPCTSPNLVDFRLRCQIMYDRLVQKGQQIDPSLIPELHRLVMLRSGKNENAARYAFVTANRSSRP